MHPKPISSASAKSTSTHYRTVITTGRHDLVADEPALHGGQDAGPAPYDYLLASLGACTAMTLQMYAEKKGWDVGEIHVDLELSKSEDTGTSIRRVLATSNPLSDEQWARLLDVAGKTPVTKSLLAGVAITSRREP
ncbi:MULTISPECIES: OsmC family protein [unclassified Rhodanobacter]|uniref:OsmC family protein n=1 Tax=unclassified Rhodanobacter TaxID=2621553 RepID=UPI001BE03135|nr:MULTISPECIES: OsmC family protein [unclassified Rhodanobacter]MBT2145697.1 OsmC family protein [Rhodanobacter sp. LX-99]MBT2149806.1 OsmC family protein [Rhodanobacter sp. LX-100]